MGADPTPWTKTLEMSEAGERSPCSLIRSRCHEAGAEVKEEESKPKVHVKQGAGIGLGNLLT